MSSHRVQLWQCISCRGMLSESCGSHHSSSGLQQGLLMLPAGVRPVPLEIHIMGFDIVNFDARLQAMARPTYSGLVHASSQVPCRLKLPIERKLPCVHHAIRNCHAALTYLQIASLLQSLRVKRAAIVVLNSLCACAEPVQRRVRADTQARAADGDGHPGLCLR